MPRKNVSQRKNEQAKQHIARVTAEFCRECERLDKALGMKEAERASRIPAPRRR